MSYILDALRRSQAERERGQVPGLHAQMGVHRELPLRRARSNALIMVMLGAALVLAVAALLSMWWLRASAPKVVAPTPTVPAIAVARAQVAAAPAFAAAVAASVAAPVPAPVASPVSAAASWPVVVSVSAPPARPPLAEAARATAGPAAGITAAVATAGATTGPAIPLAALTAEQRRDWPALVLGGSVWSDSPASRFVIFNGAVLREGDELAPGLVLERLLPKAAQLRWRGLRVEVPL